MLEFAALRPKAYSYLIDDEDENKQQTAQKSQALNLKIMKIVQKQINLKMK